MNLAIRWFIGYGLHEGLPDHSSLARIRQPTRAEHIGTLNGQIRQSGRGGTFFVTRAVASLERMRLVRVMNAVVEFNAFGPENGPHGEHDCAVIAMADATVIWHINYYDRAYTGLPPNYRCLL